MNESIERPHIAIRRTVGFKLFIASLVLLGWVLLNRLTNFRIENFGLQLFPQVIAGGETVRHGVEEFSGHEITPIKPGISIAIVLSQVLLFSVLPLFYLWLRERSRRRKEEGKRIGPLMMGAIVLVSIIGMIIPSGVAGVFYASASVFTEMKRSNQRSAYENAAQDSTAVVAYRLREFAVKSRNAGGGGGTFTTGAGPVTLAEIGIREQNELGRFLLVPQKSDTVVQLYFLGMSSSASVILESTIYPSGHRIIVLR